MSGGGIPVIAVKAEPIAPLSPSIVVAIDDLGNAAEAVIENGYVAAQVDQQITLGITLIPIADRHRRSLRVVRSDNLVWYEAALAEGPQQLVELAGLGRALDMRVHAVGQ
jgi:hypothetical protein